MLFGEDTREYTSINIQGETVFLLPGKGVVTELDLSHKSNKDLAVQLLSHPFKSKPNP
jgi:hypothetical protein